MISNPKTNSFSLCDFDIQQGRGGVYTVVGMHKMMTLILHLLTAIARLLGPGGARAIIAENLLLKRRISDARCRASLIRRVYRMQFL